MKPGDHVVGSDLDLGECKFGPLLPLPEMLTVEQYLRLEALKLALGTGDPDSAMSTDEVLKCAETMFRYIQSGVVPNSNVTKIK